MDLAECQYIFLLNSRLWLYPVCSAWDQQGRWKIILTGQLTILHKRYKQEWQLHMDFHSPVRRRDVQRGSMQLTGILLNSLRCPSGHLHLSVGREGPPGHGLHLRRQQTSLHLLQRNQITILKHYWSGMMSTFWGLGVFSPLCLTLHTLSGATAKVWCEAAPLDWSGSRWSSQTAQDGKKGKEM